MMLANALRKSILKAAIAGELTEQKGSDGDARDLLASIRKEKARLVRAGKLKKEKPLPEIAEDDVPFEIPKNWCWAHLNDVSLLIGDIDHKMPLVAESGFPYVSPTNFFGVNGIDFESAKKISAEDYERLSKKIHPEPDDIIFPRYGTIGVIRYVEDSRPFLASYSCATIKPCKKHMNPRYAYYELLSHLTKQEIVRYTNKTTQPNVGLNSIKSFLFPLPPLAEQNRIVQKVKELFIEIQEMEADEQALDALESSFPSQMKSSLLLAAMRGELTQREAGDGDARDLLKEIEREKKRLVKEKKIKKEKPLPPVEEDDAPFEIPANWCWVRLGDIVTFQNGDRGKNYPKRTEYTLNGIPWVNAGHITSDGFLSEESMNFISNEKYQELRNGKFQSGDLVYCLRGTLGKVGRVEPYCEGAVASSLMIIRPTLPDGCFREYIFQYLKSAVARQQLLQFDNGSAQPNLAAKDVAKYLLPLPPLPEQRRIVRRLEELLPLCEM